MKNKLNCVLLVDDNESDNYFHKIVIEQAGITDFIGIALNGLEAINFLKTQFQMGQQERSFPFRRRRCGKRKHSENLRRTEAQKRLFRPHRFQGGGGQIHVGSGRSPRQSQEIRSFQDGSAVENIRGSGDGEADPSRR